MEGNTYTPAQCAEHGGLYYSEEYVLQLKQQLALSQATVVHLRNQLETKLISAPPVHHSRWDSDYVPYPDDER